MITIHSNIMLITIIKKKFGGLFEALGHVFLKIRLKYNKNTDKIIKKQQ